LYAEVDGCDSDAGGSNDGNAAPWLTRSDISLDDSETFGA